MAFSLSLRYEEPRETTGRHDDSLHHTQNEVVELNRAIQSLTGDRENAEARLRMTQGQ